MKRKLKINNPKLLKKLKKEKVNILHIHWDGAIPPETIYKLSKRKGIELLLPEYDIQNKFIHYATKEDQKLDSVKKIMSFQRALRKYKMVDVFNLAINLMQEKSDLIELAVEHCRYLKSQNIEYAEVRFAPQYHTKKGLSIDKVIGYSLEGFEKGMEETGIKVKLILTIGREIDSEQSVKLVKEFLKYKDNEKIRGIDLAGEEMENPPEKHYEAFKLTFDTSFRRTVHAGEMCGEKENLKNIYTALTLLRANGIGHAIPLYKRYYKNHDLIELFIENNVRLESNPISNYNFFIENIEDLHLDQLVDAGVLVTINPDDPAMWEFGDEIYNLYFLAELYGYEFVKKVIKVSARLTV